MRDTTHQNMRQFLYLSQLNQIGILKKYISKIKSFGDMTPCILVEVYRRFTKKTSRLHVISRRHMKEYNIPYSHRPRNLKFHKK